MSFISKIDLNKYSRKRIVVILILFELLWSYSFSFLSNIFFGAEIFEISIPYQSGLFTIFLTTVVFAPLIETFIFQYVIIELTLNIQVDQKLKKTLAILFSSLAFASIHTYNVIYFIFALISGLIYSIIYLFMKKNKYINPFLIIYLMHFSYNLFGFIFFDLLGWI